MCQEPYLSEQHRKIAYLVRKYGYIDDKSTGVYVDFKTYQQIINMHAYMYFLLLVKTDPACFKIAK